MKYKTKDTQIQEVLDSIDYSQDTIAGPVGDWHEELEDQRIYQFWDRPCDMSEPAEWASTTHWKLLTAVDQLSRRLAKVENPEIIWYKKPVTDTITLKDGKELIIAVEGGKVKVTDTVGEWKAQF